MKRTVLGLALLMAVGAWAVPAAPPADSGPAPAFDVANLDRSTAPGADFNQFANGGWIAHHEIPADLSSWG
ncbi:MAG TPA: hypothetical protein VGO93_20805, partial [Candidatus Xenobia bacterium]